MLRYDRSGAHPPFRSNVAAGLGRRAGQRQKRPCHRALCALLALYMRPCRLPDSAIAPERRPHRTRRLRPVSPSHWGTNAQQAQIWDEEAPGDGWTAACGKSRQDAMAAEARTGSGPAIYRATHVLTDSMREFLSRQRYAALGTRNADGSVHVVPVIYRFDGQRFLVAAPSTTRKARNIASRQTAPSPSMTARRSGGSPLGGQPNSSGVRRPPS
jgi:hypothetical protein